MSSLTRSLPLRLVLALALMVAGLAAAVAPASANGGTSQTFSYTGDVQTFTVPSGVTSLDIQAQGGNGMGYGESSTNALGAQVRTTLSVTPGDEFDIRVGGAGAWGEGGYNGGGATINGVGTGGGGGSSYVPGDPSAAVTTLTQRWQGSGRGQGSHHLHRAARSDGRL